MARSSYGAIAVSNAGEPIAACHGCFSKSSLANCAGSEPCANRTCRASRASTVQSVIRCERFTFFALGLLAFVFCLVLGTPRRASAAPPVESVDVELLIYRGGEAIEPDRRADLKGAAVVARATYRLHRPARAGEELTLLVFADSIRTEPVLDEVTISGYFDGPYDEGGLKLTELPAGVAAKRRGERQDLVLVLDEGVTEFTLGYEVEVPHRYWPFGCINRRCSLSGAVAPLPSAKAKGGRDLPAGGRVAVPTQWQVEARFAHPGKTRKTKDGEVPRDELIVVDRSVIDGSPMAYPSVFWGPRWRELESKRRGISVEIHHRQARIGPRYPDETIFDLRRDLPGRVQAAAHEVLDLAEFTSMPLSVDAPLVVIEGPLRSELAQAHPGVVMVSDQTFELFPVDRFLKFHDVAVARAILDTLGLAWFVGQPASERAWVAGSFAMAMTELWQAQRELKDEYARDILRNVTFVPAVDRFLYTGQASFASAYFRSAEDKLTVRNHPLWFSHGLPTGRRIHEKLSDVMGREKLAALYATVSASPDASFRKAAARAYGYTLGWFFDQWLGPYPSIDYAVTGVTHEKKSDGGWRYTIEVTRDGEVGVVEPVAVLVTEWGGKQQYLQWNGEAAPGATLDEQPHKARHTFTVETERRLKNVRVDPRRRLTESSRIDKKGRAGTNFDPLFNNRYPSKGRFLYTGFGLSIAASEFINATSPAARFNAFAGFAVFEGSLQRDVRRSAIVSIFKDRESLGGMRGAGVFYFGRKINRQRRRLRLRTGGAVSILSDDSLDPRGGLRISETLRLTDNTQGFAWWPERGHYFNLGATLDQIVPVRPEDGDFRLHMQVTASWAQLWRLAHDHVIATELEFDFLIPFIGRPQFRTLQRGGGITGLSAYAADEIFGLAVATAQAEYRHVYVNNLPINAFNLGWLRSLGGAAFAGVATASPCESVNGWFGSNSWYGQIGYGVMAYVQYLGVTPQLFRVDVAVPLVRRRATCIDQVLPDYLAQAQGLPASEVNRLLPPVTVNVVFNQPF